MMSPFFLRGRFLAVRRFSVNCILPKFPPMHRQTLPFLVSALAVSFAGCPKSPPAPKSDSSQQKSPTEKGAAAIPATSSKLTEAETAALVHDFNLAIGQLENNDFDKAIPAWDDLVKRFPNEAGFARNRLICRILFVNSEAAKRVEPAEVKSKAESALADFRKVEPDSWVGWVLEAHLAKELFDGDRRVKALETAVKKRPDDPAVWCDLYEAANDLGTKSTDLMYSALKETFKQAPDNLYVICRIVLQALRRNDPELADILKQSRGEIEVISALSAARLKLDPAQGRDPATVVDNAQKAVAAGDWKNPALKSIYGLQGIFTALIADDPVQADKLAIERHHLEFTEDRFSDALKARLTLPAAPKSESAIKFSAVEGAAGQIAAADASDFAIADFNLDRRDDVLVLSPSRLELFTSTEGAWQSLAQATVTDGLSRLIALDFDDDWRDVPKAAEANNVVDEHRHSADFDAVLFGSAGIAAMRNVWNAEANTRSFEPVEAFPGLALTDVTAASPLDVDMDGDLDLIVSAGNGVHLLINLGNSTFSKQDQLLTGVPEGARLKSVVIVDYDRDNDLDVLAATADNTLVMLENLRHGLLRWKAFEGAPATTTLEVAELDGNVSWDVITAAPNALTIMHTRTVARADVQVTGTTDVKDAGDATGLLAIDFDNDGAMDLASWSATEARLWRNAGDGSLAAVPDARFASDAGSSHKVAPIDFDGDGDSDLAVLTKGGVSIWKNDTTPVGHYLNVGLVAKSDTDGGVNKNRINHYGIGSLLELKAGERYQAQTVRGPVTHFGLNGIETPEVIRITWPNGVPQNAIQPKRDTTIMELQSLHTSCPYLYSWDGEKFVFVTDLLWAAPMGLPDPSGGYVPAREWEYLKIPAKSLKPRDGRYEIRVTEELWETAYFDQIELIAVDHPADVEVFTNEKVGPAEIATPMIHTARNLRVPAAASDLTGRDILQQVTNVDDVFARTWQEMHTQGYVNTHGVEFNLGPLDSPQQVKLFLTGWLMPADACLTVKMIQHPDLEGPVPPSIEVPDGNGGWKVAIPYMGFPGGKTKGMVVDVTSILNPADPRLRIVSSQELYWDQIAFTVDEPNEPVVEQPLKLVSADLHYRGFSGASAAIENAPERYEYDWLQREPRFPHMTGRLTRYGDVAELLRVSDDRQLVLAVGDEASLSFAMPEQPLPEGWVRDFVIHNVGWEKDAQLNTVYSERVEPLPWLKMPGYPSLEERPMTPEYEEYLRTYQTRETSEVDFRRLIKKGPDASKLQW
jgi:hypothetical protein